MPIFPLSLRPQPVARSPDIRPRSKTFEEYEKDTDDAWDEEPGDISHLSSPAAQLEFDHSGEMDVKIAGKTKSRHMTIQQCHHYSHMTFK